MVRARSAIMRGLQQFFETELRGLYRWGAGIDILPPEPNAEKDPDRPLRSRVFGKHREAVTVVFGVHTITVQSPNDAPPVGCITLYSGGEVIEGPIDAETWKRIGAYLREAERQNVDQRSEQRAERPPERVGAGTDPIPGWGGANL